MIRAFVAIELTEQVRENLRHWQAQLKAGGYSFVKWVEPSGIHLTLKFLGNVPENRITSLTAALTEAVKGVGSFRLQLTSPGAFPNLHRPRVVWVGLGGEVEKLLSLQDQVEKILNTLGFPRENRPFTPHLTLGRVREGASTADARYLGEAIASLQVESGASFTVTAVILMQSTLTPHGALYHPLAVMPLG